MKSVLKPALDNLDRALLGLESAVEERLSQQQAAAEAQDNAPQLELHRNEREVSRKLAAKLDQTISRLETILSEEE